MTALNVDKSVDVLISMSTVMSALPCVLNVCV